MFDLIIYLLIIAFSIILFLSFFHAFVTHLIVYYEMRVKASSSTENSEKNEIFVSWLDLTKSFFIESGCNFIRFFLFPFSMVNYKSVTKEGTPILLIHGYMQNQMDWLWFRHKLQKTENLGPVYTLNLYPPFNSIAQHAALIQQKVEEIQKETNQKNIILIGHSMGGLVSCYYSEFLAKPNEISMVINLGSPFQGTRLAALGVGENVKEMLPNSSFLTELSSRMEHSKTAYYFVASKLDNVIVPWQASFPAHHNMNNDNSLILESHGHLRLLISPRVIKQITDWVQANQR